MKKQILKY